MADDQIPVSELPPTQMPDDDVVDLAAVRSASRAAHPSTGDGTVDGQVSYFGTEQEHDVYLPDGVSFVTHKDFSEGDRKKYLAQTNRDLRLQQRTGEAFLKTSPGEDRHALLRIAITGWNILGPDGNTLRFSEQNVKKALDSWPPHIIDIVEKDIRVHNPWLNSEVTIEQIDAEIENLQKMRADKVKEIEGKGDSSN